MATWKKIIYSGSNASLAEISASVVPQLDNTSNLLTIDSATGGITQITQDNLGSNIGDDLGNHTATQTLNLNNNAISNVLTLNTLTVGYGGGGVTTNTAVGVQALLNNTDSGLQNVAVGYQALKTNTTGDTNVAVGPGALFGNTSGGGNVAIGYKALEDNTSGGSNIALGYIALRNNSSGNYNTAIGRQALRSNTTGLNNIAIGYRSLDDNSSGDDNVALGYEALTQNTTGYRNIALGYRSLKENTTGNQNVSLGYISLENNTTGDRNIALGDSALYSNTTGENNVVLGADALYNNISGNNNIAIGHEAGKYTNDSSGNPGINAYGGGNVFIGKDSRNGEHSFLTGEETAIASNYNTIVIGTDAVSVGKNSVVLGNDSIELTALKGKIGIETVTPMNSLQINHSGGDGNNGMMIVRADLSTVNSNILGGIGFDSTDGNVPSSVLEASAYIASFASETHGTSDKGGELAFGTAGLNENDDTVSNEVMRLTDGGDVGIGITAPTKRLEVHDTVSTGAVVKFKNLSTNFNADVLDLQIARTDDADGSGLNNSNHFISFLEGDGNLSGRVRGSGAAVQYVTTSDRRLKSNVTSSQYGLTDLMEIDVVDYNFTGSSEISTGIIAQDLNKIFPEAVAVEGAGTGSIKVNSSGGKIPWGIDYGKLTPLLVNAVQDQQVLIQKLEERLKALENS